MIELIGNIKLADLKARDVQAALTRLAMQKSTRSVRMYRMVLVRAIRHAQINDLAMRNVAELISVPAGQPGRPSKAFTLEQALPCWNHRLWAYVAVSLLGGLRTEEARALRWSEVDLEAAPWLSTARCGSAGTPRPRSPAELSNSPISPSRRCGNWVKLGLPVRLPYYL